MGTECSHRLFRTVDSGPVSNKEHLHTGEQLSVPTTMLIAGPLASDVCDYALYTAMTCFLQKKVNCLTKTVLFATGVFSSHVPSLSLTVICARPALPVIMSALDEFIPFIQSMMKDAPDPNARPPVGNRRETVYGATIPFQVSFSSSNVSCCNLPAITGLMSGRCWLQTAHTISSRSRTRPRRCFHHRSCHLQTARPHSFLRRFVCEEPRARYHKLIVC